MRAEKMVPPADGHNTVRGRFWNCLDPVLTISKTGQWDPSIHGTNGMVALSLPGYPTVLDPRVVRGLLAVYTLMQAFDTTVQ
jgi:hypothetical protein